MKCLWNLILLEETEVQSLPDFREERVSGRDMIWEQELEEERYQEITGMKNGKIHTGNRVINEYRRKV